MGRLTDELTPYRVKIHKIGKYNYASTQPITDNQTSNGKKKHCRIHLGTLDENNKFHPNETFWSLPCQERKKLIFPDDWDTSEIENKHQTNTMLSSASKVDETNLLYGDVWFLEHVAMRTGLIDDLNRATGYKDNLARDILYLAIFRLTQGDDYSRVYNWRNVERLQDGRHFGSLPNKFDLPVIDSDTMDDLFRLRLERTHYSGLWAVDSISGSFCKSALSTNTMVIYDSKTELPVRYHVLPNAIPGSRSIKDIRDALKSIGLSRLPIITEKGYTSLRNIERHILKKDRLVMPVSVLQPIVFSRIRELFNDDSQYTDKMTLIKDGWLFCREYDLNYNVDIRKGLKRNSERLRLFIYVDPDKRRHQMDMLSDEIAAQHRALATLKDEEYLLDDDDAIINSYRYFKIKLSGTARTVKSYKLNNEKITEAKLAAGFFAIATNALDYDAETVLKSCEILEGHKRFFRHTDSDGQSRWSEEEWHTRFLINFAAMILDVHVKRILKSCYLALRYNSTTGIYDEMRSIRWIKPKGLPRIISPFTDIQADIADAFDFIIPKGCEPKPKGKNAKMRFLF